MTKRYRNVRSLTQPCGQPQLQRLVWGTACLLFLVSPPTHAFAQAAELGGVVADATGGTIAGALVVLQTTHGIPVHETRSGGAGTFAIAGILPGTYWLEVRAANFAPERIQVVLGREAVQPLKIVMGLAPFGSEVTVTAERGAITDVQETTTIVTVGEQDEFRRQPLATIGNALTGAAGVMIQQSTYGQVSPFLRG